MKELLQELRVVSIDVIQDAFDVKNDIGEIQYIDSQMYLSDLELKSRPIMKKLNQ